MPRFHADVTYRATETAVVDAESLSRAEEIVRETLLSGSFEAEEGEDIDWEDVMPTREILDVDVWVSEDSDGLQPEPLAGPYGDRKRRPSPPGTGFPGPSDTTADQERLEEMHDKAREGGV